MRVIIMLILLRATFVTSTTAAITWDQPAGITQTCLRRIYGAPWPAGICWENLPSGPMRVNLPGQLTHPAYRPAWGDVYILSFEGVDVGRVTLGETPNVYQLYLPSMTKQSTVGAKPLYLPVIRR